MIVLESELEVNKTGIICESTKKKNARNDRDCLNGFLICHTWDVHLHVKSIQRK